MELRRQLRIRACIALTAAAHIFAIVFGVPALLHAQPAEAAQSVPYKINFQGRLTDNSGNVLTDGLYNVKFRLWTAASGGSNQWEEDRVMGSSDNRVQITNGLFNIQFGDLTAITPSLFSTGTGTLYLEVELPTPATATCATNGCAVFTEGAMTPRQPLAASPYALNAQSLGGVDAGSFVQLSPGARQTGSISVDNTISTTGTIQAATVDAQTAGALTLGGTNASSVALAKNTTMAAGLTLSLQGTSALNLGSTTAAGGIVFKDGTTNNYAVTLNTPALTGSYSLSWPTTGPGLSQCLQSGSSTASQLIFASCGTGSGANTALSNLASVAINTTLLPGSTNSINLGSSGLTFQTGYFGTSVISPSLDSSAGLNIGTSNTTTIVLGRSSQAVSIPSGIDASGTYTGSNTRLNLGGTLSSSVTTTNYGFQNQITYTPTGASLSDIYALLNLPSISGFSGNITNIHGAYSRIDTAASYTGQTAFAAGFQSGPPQISGTKPITSYNGLYVDTNSSNVGASGNPVTNYGVNINTPSANSSFTTNYGLYIQGNGGGTATNYSLYNASTAASYYAGNIASAGTVQASTFDTQSAGTLSIGAAQATITKVGTAATATLAGVKLLTTLAEITTTLRVGDGTDGFNFDKSTGPSYTGTARPTRRISGSPEFAGAVLRGDGTSNTGTMTTAFDATNFHNYYNWTTSQGTNQDFDVAVRVPVPNDFSALTLTPQLCITAWSDDLTNGTVTANVNDSSNAAVTLSSSSFTPGSPSTWTETCRTISGTPTITAGGFITLRTTLQAASGKNTRLGEFRIDYLSKF